MIPKMQSGFCRNRIRRFAPPATWSPLDLVHPEPSWVGFHMGTVGHIPQPVGERAQHVRSSAALGSARLRPSAFSETRARVFVFSTGPPFAGAFFSTWCRSIACQARVAAPILRGPFFVGRLPQASARKPLQNHVSIGTAQLCERGKELRLLTRTECGGFLIDQNRPERVTRRHGRDCIA